MPGDVRELAIERLTPESDLAAIVAALDPADWDELNDLVGLDPDALRELSGNPDYYYLLAYKDGQLVGTALAVRLRKPCGTSWMYVDELDVRPCYRRQGIGRALMQRLFDHAKDGGMDEVWLGTEFENASAGAFYGSLSPDETLLFNFLTFVFFKGDKARQPATGLASKMRMSGGPSREATNPSTHFLNAGPWKCASSESMLSHSPTNTTLKGAPSLVT